MSPRSFFWLNVILGPVLQQLRSGRNVSIESVQKQIIGDIILQLFVVGVRTDHRDIRAANFSFDVNLTGMVARWKNYRVLARIVQTHDLVARSRAR